MQKHKRAHSFTRVLGESNPTSRTRERRLLCRSSFFECSLWEGLLMKAVAEFYTVTSLRVVSYHSHLLLVNRIKCAAWPQDECQDVFWPGCRYEAVASELVM